MKDPLKKIATICIVLLLSIVAQAQTGPSAQTRPYLDIQTIREAIVGHHWDKVDSFVGLAINPRSNLSPAEKKSVAIALFENGIATSVLFDYQERLVEMADQETLRSISHQRFVDRSVEGLEPLGRRFTLEEGQLAPHKVRLLLKLVERADPFTMQELAISIMSRPSMQYAIAALKSFVLKADHQALNMMHAMLSHQYYSPEAHALNLVARTPGRPAAGSAAREFMVRNELFKAYSPLVGSPACEALFLSL